MTTLQMFDARGVWANRFLAEIARGIAKAGPGELSHGVVSVEAARTVVGFIGEHATLLPKLTAEPGQIVFTHEGIPFLVDSTMSGRGWALYRR